MTTDAKTMLSSPARAGSASMGLRCSTRVDWGRNCCIIQIKARTVVRRGEESPLCGRGCESLLGRNGRGGRGYELKKVKIKVDLIVYTSRQHFACCASYYAVVLALVVFFPSHTLLYSPSCPQYRNTGQTYRRDKKSAFSSLVDSRRNTLPRT